MCSTTVFLTKYRLKIFKNCICTDHVQMVSLIAQLFPKQCRMTTVYISGYMAIGVYKYFWQHLKYMEGHGWLGYIQILCILQGFEHL